VKGKQDEAKHSPDPGSLAAEHGGGPGQEGVSLTGPSLSLPILNFIKHRSAGRPRRLPETSPDFFTTVMLVQDVETAVAREYDYVICGECRDCPVRFDVSFVVLLGGGVTMGTIYRQFKCS
jgi:hypothetical protein